MRASVTTSLVLGFIALTWNLECGAVSVEKDLTMTPREKATLDKFKGVVSKYLSQDYMKKDIYLIKCLRAKNLDIEGAKQMLLNNIQWRQNNGMDGILDEDFSKFELEFPMTVDGTDYSGRPIMTFDVSQWDMRRIILSGQREMVERYIYRNVETVIRRVREAQKKGVLVTQILVIANFKGFNLIQHGCGQCIPVYINLILALENYYAEMLHKFIIVNTPPSFEIVLRLLRPVMSRSTQEALAIYGNNRRDWEPVILNLVSPDEIDQQFGGNRID